MSVNLQRIGWEDGTLVSPAKVSVGGTVYDVTPEVYSGSTPLSAENLKQMEDNTENAINDGIIEANTYSTTEKRIGTWINGKPIYRRVYDLGNLPNSDTKEISHGISNFGRLIRIYGNAYRSTDGFSVGLPYSYPTAETNIGLSVINDSIRLVTGVDRSNMTGYAVIEYTKTTD